MNTMEAIRTRRSVRTFDGRALREEDARRILDFARMAENPYELPVTWMLLDAKKDVPGAPVITGTDAYLAGKMRRADHAEEAFGYTFEKIVLFAQTIGVGTTWIAGTMNRAAFERAAGLSAGEVMPCVSPLGYAAKKMSLRETMMRKGVRADSRMDFQTLFFLGDFDTPLMPEAAGQCREPLEAVRLSPSAVNKQPWRAVLRDGAVHFYEKKNKSSASADAWDVQKIDMGIALCHFELGAESVGLPFSFRIADPGIPAPENTFYIASYELA